MTHLTSSITLKLTSNVLTNAEEHAMWTIVCPRSKQINKNKNNYKLLYFLLYNTGIYLDEYTAWKDIVDEPIGESSMTFPAVYESKYIPVLYSEMYNNLVYMYSTVQYVNNIFLLDPLREYIGRSRGTNADCWLVRFIWYIISILIGQNDIERHNVNLVSAFRWK